MPSASQELSEQFPGGEVQATEELVDAGYRLTPKWEWLKPTPEHVVTDREWACIRFMFEEWDYGGLVPKE